MTTKNQRGNIETAGTSIVLGKDSASPATIAKSNASSATITLPGATTTVVGRDTTDTLTNKTIDGDNNTVQDLPVTAIKTVLVDANKVLVRDGSGVPSSAFLVNANVDAAAAIALSKLATVTGSKALQSSAGGVIEPSAVTSTELGYVAGVTSAIQTQLDGKVDENAAIVGATKTKITYDAKGLVTAGADLAAGDLPTGIDAAKIADGSVSNTEFQYIGGLTSDAQTQIDAKAPKASPTFSGTVLLQNAAGSQPELALSEDPDNGTNKVTIKAPAALGADYTLTLPTDDGSANQVLQTDGSGVLSWASPLSNPMSDTGDLIYGGAAGTATRLAGNTATTRNFLRQTGNGSASAAPAWDTLQANDYPLATSAGARGAVDPYTTNGVVYADNYTPTLANGTNVTSSTLSSARYSRVGKIVTVSGKISATLTAANTASVVTLSLPVSSNMTAATDASGSVGTRNGGNVGAGFIEGDSGDLLVLVFANPATGSCEVGFSAQYIIK